MPPPSNSTEPRSPWPRALALSLGSLCVALLLAEGALRLLGVAYPVFRQPDDDLGVALRPGAEGWYTSEGRSYVRINSAGLLDREHAVRKPAGTFRIAVLGDSMAEGMQVPVEQTFWRQLETRLAGCPALEGRTPEVINFAVSGYSTAQELVMLRQHVWQYQPDAVLLAVFPGNDIGDNHALLTAARTASAIPDQSRPYFVDRGGRLVIEPPNTESPLKKRLRAAAMLVIDHSRIAQLVYAVRQKTRARPMVDQNGRVLSVDEAVFAPPATKEWTAAWRVTEGLLELMAREARDHGASLVLVPIPVPIQTDPDAAARAGFAKRLGVEDLSYPTARLASFGRGHGIPVIPLEEAFRTWAEAHGQYLFGFPNAFPGYGHMNAHGHRVAAELISERLCFDDLSNGERSLHAPSVTGRNTSP